MKNSHNQSNRENWIWGLFYYNKNDKRLFPPKRHPWMGWTVNFADPASVAILLLIILVIVCAVLVKAKYQ